MFLRDIPPQDCVIYGLSHKYVVDVLTIANWSESAVIRVELLNPSIWLYLWIRIVDHTSSTQYVVRCVGPRSASPKYEMEFHELAQALSYTNGDEEGSELARYTRVAHREEWPPESPPNAILSGRYSSGSV